jgi:hypothetical protein
VGRQRQARWGFAYQGELLRISPELPRVLLPDARHTTTICVPQVLEDQDSVVE